MADIDKTQSPALCWIIGHGTGSLWVDFEPLIKAKYGARWDNGNGDLAPLAREELSQLIADVRREAKAEALLAAEALCAKLLVRDIPGGLRAFNNGVGACIRAIAAGRLREGEEQSG